MEVAVDSSPILVDYAYVYPYVYLRGPLRCTTGPPKDTQICWTQAMSSLALALVTEVFTPEAAPEPPMIPQREVWSGILPSW